MSDKDGSHGKDKVALAADVAQQHFGPMPGAIVSHLLAHGKCSLVELAGHLKGELQSTASFDIERLRRALLVLIHHGAVAFEVGAPTKYFTVPDMLILRLQHATIMQKSRVMYGDAGYYITKYLLRHGRLPEEALLDLLMEDAESPYSQIPIDKSRKKYDALKQTIHAMMKFHYIETVPKVPSRQATLQAAAAKQWAEKEALENSKRSATALGDANPSAKRMKRDAAGGMDIPNDDGWEEGIDIDDGRGRPGGARAEDTAAELNIDAVLAGTEDLNLDADSLLRVNLVKYILRSRNEAVIDVTHRLFGPMEADIVRALLTHPERVSMLPQDPTRCVPPFHHLSPSCHHRDFTSYLSQINAELNQRSSDLIERLREGAKVGPLVGEPFVRSAGSNSYAVCVKRIADAAKEAQCEYILQRKYGMLGRRVHKILRENKVLEEKEIIAKALASDEDTGKLLYQMKREGYLQVREIPMTADMNPQKTIYLWYVPENLVERKLLDEMYHTLRNLYARRMHNANEIAPLVKLGASKEGLRSLSEEQIEKLEAWESTQETLGFSITSLYEMICTLEHYS